MTFGPGSVVFIMREDSDNAPSASDTPMTANTSAGVTQWSIQRTGTEALQFFTAAGGGQVSETAASFLTAAMGWCLIAITKPTGLDFPTFHRYRFDDNSFTTATGGSSTDNGTAPGTGGTYRFGEWEDVDDFNGQLLIAGLYNVVLTADQIRSMAFDLAAWFQVQPMGLWIFDQAETTQNVMDMTGNGANQSLLQGTAVSTESTPIWNYGAGAVLVLIPAAAGATPITVSDGLSLSEALTVAAAVGVTDGLTLAEALALVATFDLLDALTMTDTPAVAATVDLADGLTLSEALTVTSPVDVADGLSLSEALTVAPAVPVADPLTLAETLTLDAAVPVADPLTLGDVVDVNTGATVVTVADPLSLSEALTTSAAVPVTEPLTEGEALTLTATVPVSESLTLSEVPDLLVTLTLTDSLTLAETVTVTVPINVSDALALAEALGVTVAVPLTEPLTLGEGLTVSAVLAVLESLALADVLAVVGPGVLNNESGGIEIVIRPLSAVELVTRQTSGVELHGRSPS